MTIWQMNALIMYEKGKKTTFVKDTLMALEDFKSKQKSLWSNVFLICKSMYLLELYSIHYTLRFMTFLEHFWKIFETFCVYDIILHHFQKPSLWNHRWYNMCYVYLWKVLTFKRFSLCYVFKENAVALNCSLYIF